MHVWHSRSRLLLHWSSKCSPVRTSVCRICVIVLHSASARRSHAARIHLRTYRSCGSCGECARAVGNWICALLACKEMHSLEVKECRTFKSNQSPDAYCQGKFEVTSLNRPDISYSLVESTLQLARAHSKKDRLDNPHTQTARTILRQVARCLYNLHSKHNVIHGDLKPRNIVQMPRFNTPTVSLMPCLILSWLPCGS